MAQPPHQFSRNYALHVGLTLTPPTQNEDINSKEKDGPCGSKSPARKELMKTLVKLREEKDEIEAKLPGKSCKISGVQRELNTGKERLADLNNTVNKLTKTMTDTEGEIQRLKDKSTEQKKAIDTLTERVGTVKTKLQGAVTQATKDLQVETQERISIQEEIVNGPQENELQLESSDNTNVQGQDYSYPIDATTYQPPRYFRFQPPPRKVPFPQDAMDEAERLGHENPNLYKPSY